MRFLVCLVLFVILGDARSARAGSIDGTVIIRRRLTKRRVTPAVGVYDRGTAVALKTDSPEDDLAFERERVVVYLEGDLASTKIVAKLAQENRRFVPDTISIPAGSTVSFPNLDPIFHNVFSLSKPKSFDLGNYPKDHTRTVVFEKPGIVFVNCHLHPNMSAVIVVTPNSWATKPDGQGKFALSGVPNGSYTIVAWHKSAGFFRHQITVGDQATPVEFLIPFDK